MSDLSWFYIINLPIAVLMTAMSGWQMSNGDWVWAVANIALASLNFAIVLNAVTR